MTTEAPPQNGAQAAAPPTRQPFAPAPPRSAPKRGMPTDGFLLFVGLPKAGKTRLASSIPDSVIIELEQGGADRLDGWVQEVSDLPTFREAMKWAIGEPKVKTIVVDSTDALLDLLEQDILERHELGSMMDRKEGVNTWNELTKHVNAMVKRFKECGKLVVGLSHFKASKLDSEGRLVVSHNLEAPGKIGPNLLAKADLIGSCSKSRVGTRTEYAVSFQGGGTLGTFGSRVDELEGKTVVIPKKNGWAAIVAACAEGALDHEAKAAGSTSAAAKKAEPDKAAEPEKPAAEKQREEPANKKARPLSPSQKKKEAAAAAGAR